MDAKTYGRVMSNELEQCFEFYTAVVVLGKMILITESVSLLNMALSTNHFPTAGVKHVQRHTKMSKSVTQLSRLYVTEGMLRAKEGREHLV